jgi:outer membrane protein TolC
MLIIGAAVAAEERPAAAASPVIGSGQGAPLERALELGDFVHRVVLGNAGAQVARLQTQAAERLVQAERALYDPSLFGRLRRDRIDRPRSTDEVTSGLFTSAGGEKVALERNDTLASGVRGRLPSGATLELSHDLRRRASNLLGDQADREYRGTLSLTLKQPLLRGRGRESTEADLRVAEMEHAVELQRLAKQVLELVGESAGAWWRLHTAHRVLAMRTASLRTAFDLEAEARSRVEGGFAPRTDLLEAGLAIAARRTEIARAQQFLMEAQARARTLLGGSIGPGEPALVARGEPATTGEHQGMELARFSLPLLARWPAYQIARLRLEQEQARLDYAVLNERADLSVELGLNRNSLTDALGSSLSQSLGAKHPGWYAGLLLEMPLDNGAARSRKEAQWLRRDAARVQVEGEARLAADEWAVRQAQVLASRVEIEQLNLELEVRQALLAAEQENHRMGRSRLRVLIEAQDRLDEGQLRLLDARLRARLAELAYLTIDGGLLKAFDVEFATR